MQIAWAIGELAADPSSETDLVECGAIEALIRFQRTCNEDLKKRATWSYRLLSEEAKRWVR